MENSRYQTFGRRFLAGIIDGFVLLPISFIEFAVVLLADEVLLKFWFILHAFIPYIYSILMHGKYGQTLGKMATKVKVIDVSEEKPINFYQALMRDSVPLIYSVSMIFIFYFYYGFFPIQNELDPNFVANSSGFIILMAIWGMFGFIWFLAEIISMLTNDKRRALHDLMAKSVVIKM